jgi:nicotinamidase/pyrazinamidase
MATAARATRPSTRGLKAHLVIIDPQHDFMDTKAEPGDPVGMAIPGGPTFRSTLPVPGALEDMERVAALIRRVGPRLDDIHVTLDSHRIVGVERPTFWRDANNKPPAPFTIISFDDVANDVWRPRSLHYRKRMLDYTAALKQHGKFALMVWPVHCVIGSWGHNVVESLKVELDKWEEAQFANIDYVVKGTNAFTEHYGALMAEVPDQDDPSTQLNSAFISTLQEADIIGIAGEASSHCVKTTVEQIVENIGDAHLPKLHILTDCMSPVPQTPGSPDFPAIAQQFLKDMEKRGLVLSTSKRFLA